MKKAILIGLPLLLVVGGGATFGLATLGVVKVPFLSPKGKSGPPPPKDDGKGGPFAPLAKMATGVLAQAAAAPVAKPPALVLPPPDPGPGEEKLAGLWAEMPTPQLVALTDKWPLPQLGRILAKMDDEVVTNLLAALPASRAASLSKAVAAATDDSASKSPTGTGK